MLIFLLEVAMSQSRIVNMVMMVFILELALKLVVRVNSLLAHVQDINTQWPGLR